MSANAEQTAINALRDYLLRVLPAKVLSLNGARNAVLRAPLAGPYRFSGVEQLVLGKVIDTALVTLTPPAGTYTAAQLANLIVLAGGSGLTPSADSKGRLVITADAAPDVDAPSVVWLGQDGFPGSNAMFGWGPGGQEVVVCAVVAPGFDGIHDGEPEYADLGAGFSVVIGKRTSTPDGNIRRDLTAVTLNLSILAAEPQGRISAASEYIGACVRAVRECIYEDRSLDGAVHLTELPSVQFEGRTFRFQLAQQQSGLMSEAPLQVLIKVYERN